MAYAPSASKEEFWLDESERSYEVRVIMNQDPTAIIPNRTFGAFSSIPRRPGVTAGEFDFLRSTTSIHPAGLLNNSMHGSIHEPLVEVGINTRSTPPEFIPLSLSEEVSCINPFVTKGVQGVFDQRRTWDDNDQSWVINTRVDVPGAEKFIIGGNYERLHMESVEADDVAAEIEPRNYCFSLRLACTCCKITQARQKTSNGVSRWLIRISPKAASPTRAERSLKGDCSTSYD